MHIQLLICIILGNFFLSAGKAPSKLYASKTACALAAGVRRQRTVVYAPTYHPEHPIIFQVFFFILRHTEVPRLGVESKLLLPTYTTATTMPDLSRSLRPTPQTIPQLTGSLTH